MKRVIDDKVILCPFCDKELREISYDMLLKRDNGKELIQFTLGCPSAGCETEVTHTTFKEFEREVWCERRTFEDQMALDRMATGDEDE